MIFTKHGLKHKKTQLVQHRLTFDEKGKVHGTAHGVKIVESKEIHSADAPRVEEVGLLLEASGPSVFVEEILLQLNTGTPSDAFSGGKPAAHPFQRSRAHSLQMIEPMFPSAGEYDAARAVPSFLDEFVELNILQPESPTSNAGRWELLED